MQVNYITKSQVKIQQNRSKTNNYFTSNYCKLQCQKDKVSFTAFKDFETRVQEKKPQKGVFKKIGWWWSGEDNAKEEVAREMRGEIGELESVIAGKKVILNGLENTLSDLEQAGWEIQSSKQGEIDALEKTKKNHRSTIMFLDEKTKTQDTIIVEKKLANEKLRDLLLQQQNLIEQGKTSINELQIKMETAKKNNDIKLQDELKQQMKKIETLHKQEMETLAKTINDASHTVQFWRDRGNQKNMSGFGRIAGYAQEKNILTNLVGNLVGLEKLGKPTDLPPSGILFYGPQGNGKTTFAEALAGQLGCKLVRISSQLDPAKDMKRLREEAQKAQELFEKEKTRTIILINEFDLFAPIGSRITGPMKQFMDSASKDSHCTLFATTNYPERIDDILLREKRFDVRVGLAPAGKEDVIEILKHYANKYADKTVNYEELADQIVNVKPNDAFSNAQLESIVNAIIPTKINLGKKISHNDLLKSIEKHGPNIKKDALELFETQLEYVAKHL